MIRHILRINDPILRSVSASIPIDEIGSPEVQQVIDDLIDTKRAFGLSSLSAPQIGSSLQIFVIENGVNDSPLYRPLFPLTVVINPEIELLWSECFYHHEDCPSVPGVQGLIPRSPAIRLRGFDRNAKPLTRSVRGVSAGAVQHECDHLNGILFVDRLQEHPPLRPSHEGLLRAASNGAERARSVFEKYGSY